MCIINKTMYCYKNNIHVCILFWFILNKIHIEATLEICVYISSNMLFNIIHITMSYLYIYIY